jgi:hypothetical protein
MICISTRAARAHRHTATASLALATYGHAHALAARACDQYPQLFTYDGWKARRLPLRRLAYYLTVVEAALPRTVVEREAGLSICHSRAGVAVIEDRRDEPSFDRLISALSQDLWTHEVRA